MAEESTPNFGIGKEDDGEELGDFVRGESDYDDAFFPCVKGAGDSGSWCYHWLLLSLAAAAIFSHDPEWYELNSIKFPQSEAQSVSVFVHHLLNEQVDAPQLDPKVRGRETGSSLSDLKDQYHPVWGHIENYTAGREKRKQLLLMLC
ncbi:Phosphatidylinositol 4-kinase alpha 1 [Camellia lanceoleosa]|uniref:Phosphatidylinositol 4-kinase alpha 1 n=1 Tax=Camellia lanceoleosa TaxID=1840588 RepID=A0ACC0FY88_9ERIC|nr:Phosphatidylinositol 4-kinase alpha 1 [Camellia lanceoleosa]